MIGNPASIFDATLYSNDVKITTFNRPLSWFSPIPNFRIVLFEPKQIPTPVPNIKTHFVNNTKNITVYIGKRIIIINDLDINVPVASVVNRAIFEVRDVNINSGDVVLFNVPRPNTLLQIYDWNLPISNFPSLTFQLKKLDILPRGPTAQDVLKKYNISTKGELMNWLRKNHPDKGGDRHITGLVIDAAKKIGLMT